MTRAVLLTLVSVAFAANTITLKDCGASPLFTIHSLDFAPSAPVPGQNGTLHTVYSVPSEVSAGTVKYSCALNGLPIYSESFDLCSQTTCPVTAGVHDDFSTSEVPNTSGKVSCTIDWRGSEGAQLLCIQMIMNLALKSNLRGATWSNQSAWHPKFLYGTNLNGTFNDVEANSYCEPWAPWGQDDDVEKIEPHTHGGNSKALVALASYS